jgi:hypothetical protein
MGNVLRKSGKRCPRTVSPLPLSVLENADLSDPREGKGSYQPIVLIHLIARLNGVKR